MKSILKKKTLPRFSRGKVGQFAMCIMGTSNSKLSQTDGSGRLLLLISSDSSCLAQKNRMVAAIMSHCISLSS